MPRDIHIITIHPDFINSYCEFGVFSSAIKKNLINLHIHNLRDYAVDKHGSIDDYPYGGGDSMIMRPEPLAECIDSIKSKYNNVRVFYTAPIGKKWDAHKAEQLASPTLEPFIFICGRFGGIDQRIVDLYVDELISIGDFVLSGGELAVLSVVDSILRFIPGVLGKLESATMDSFGSGLSGKKEHPVYTRPAEFRGISVPDVLTSGDHKKINDWKKQNLKD